MSECKHPQGFDFDSLCYECGADSSDVVFKLQAELAALREAARDALPNISIESAAHDKLAALLEGAGK